MRPSLSITIALALVLASLASFPLASAAPTVTAIATCPTNACTGPASGTENGGTVMKITGAGFSAGATVCLDNLVNGACPLDKAASQVIVSSGTEIRATTPARADVSVDTPTNVVIRNVDAQTTVITNGFTYTNADAPDLTSLSPNSGSSNGGTLVTLKGTKFDPLALRPLVCFGSIAAAAAPCGTQPTAGANGARPAAVVTVKDATTIEAVTPPSPGTAGQATSVDVTVTYTSGSDALASHYTFIPAASPTISSSSPSSGGTNGGTRVTVTGTNFAPGAKVLFGGVEGTEPIFTSSTTVSALVPATTTLPPEGDASAVPVKVINPDGQHVTQASGFNYVRSAAPDVTELFPTFGPTFGGQIIALAGTNFAPGAVLCDVPETPPPVCPEDSIIEPQGMPTSTLAYFPVPQHAAGTASFWILNPDGQSDQVPTGFTYKEAFVITEVSPATGPANGGTDVTLTGHNFACGTGNLPTVTFGGAAVNPLQVTPGICTGGFTTTLAVDAPGHAAGQVDIVVNNPSGLAAVFQKGYQYQSSPDPTITTVSPTSGTANGGTTVIITGTNFACNLADGADDEAGPKPVVKFGTVVADASTVAVSGCTGALGTTLTVPSPPHVAGSVNVEVINPSGRSVSKSGAYSYSSAAPSITGIATCADDATATPCAGSDGGSANGGTILEITGTGFRCTGATTDGSPTEVEVFFGATTAKYGDVPTSSHFPSPKVTVEAVCSGSPPTTTILRAISPGHAAGDVDITVRNPSNEKDSGTNNFEYDTATAPTISSISDGSGRQLGGEAITVTGNHFGCSDSGPLPAVKLGNVAVPAVDVAVPDCSDGVGTTLTFVTPPHASQNDVSLVITNPSGQSATLTNAYDYNVASPSPQITSLSVNQGTSLGGTNVTIVGTSFFCDSDGPKPTVSLGGTVIAAADLTLGTCVHSEELFADDDNRGFTTTLSFRTPPRSGCTSTGGCIAAPIVTNPDGQQGSMTGGFRYLIPLPSLTNLSPASGSTLGGPVVTVTGTNFQVGAAALFGVDLEDEPVPAPAVAVPSGTSILAKTPAHAAGAVDVTIVSPDGQSATLASAYTFIAASPPTATSITPTKGSIVGGTSFTITGANLGGLGTEVCFGSLVDDQCPEEAKATDVAVTGGTTLTGKTPTHALGTVDVNVLNPDGQSSAPMIQAFTFLGVDQLPVPAITGLSPASGPATGGTVVTITGTNLAGDSVGVTFGGTAATEVSSTATTVTATTPAHAAGKVSVVVTVDGQAVTETEGFEYTGSGGGDTPPSPPSPPAPPAPPTPPATPPGDSTTPPTAAQIVAANEKIVVTVTREGDTNVVSWTLPTSGLPATPTGVQVWASNSPYSLLQTCSSSSTCFTSGEFTHSGSEAKASTKYLVTMFYGPSGAFGLFTASTAPDTADYPGVSSEGGTGGGDGGLPTWAIVLIILGILFLVVLVAILIARGRNREDGGQQATTQGYAWEESKSADAEWQGEGQAGEVHQARCPACATSFTATGAKPIVTVCPGCGKKGILR